LSAPTAQARTALLLMIDPWTLDRLLAFDADAAELEDADGEHEPDQEIDGPATVLDFVPPKQVDRLSRVAQALALALFLVTVPYATARADQAPAIMRPLPTAEAPAQCCRICRKGQPCGDACISSTKQCKKEQSCACSAASKASQAQPLGPGRGGARRLPASTGPVVHLSQ
jgi:hypothetical protein